MVANVSGNCSADDSGVNGLVVIVGQGLEGGAASGQGQAGLLSFLKFQLANLELWAQHLSPMQVHYCQHWTAICL